jgi:hypothetical protein
MTNDIARITRALIIARSYMSYRTRGIDNITRHLKIACSAYNSKRKFNIKMHLLYSRRHYWHEGFKIARGAKTCAIYT